MRAILWTSMLLLAIISSHQANAALIMSGLDDECESCLLSDSAASTYVNPNGTLLDGAIWIQDIDGWNTIGKYTISESDIANLGQQLLITSLFVSFDDSLVIMNGSNTLFDSLTYSLTTPWKGIVDVISLTGALSINALDGLSFIVDNSFGATGVIWKGEVTTFNTNSANAVSAPSQLGLMGLFLIALSILRRKKI